MCLNPTVHSDAYAGSENVTDGNMFNSPDGMMFDSTGLLWIQTDGDGTLPRSTIVAVTWAGRLRYRGKALRGLPCPDR